MNTDKLTTIFGTAAAIAATAAANGIQIGHFHGLTFTTLIAGITGSVFAWLTNKK